MLAALAPEEAPAPPPAVAEAECVQVEGVVPLVPGSGLRVLLPLAIAASLALHVAAAAAILIARTALPEYGVLETASDARSLETAQSIVLESTLSEPVDTAAAAAAAMPQGSMPQVDADPVPVKEIDVAPVEDAAAPSIKTAKVDASATEASEEPLEVLSGAGAPAETVPAKAAKEEVDAKKEHREERRERTRRQDAGGPTSRSTQSTGSASARASASSGSVLSYAARVRAKVVGNKPSGRGYHGTAQVSFGVSGSGGLSYTRLARSSGNPSLDQAALAAVRRAAPFGAPPAGASSAQLRFTIPFYFR